MADKAKLLGDTHLDLLLGRKPTLPPSQWEVNFQKPYDVSPSPNKEMVSNGNAALWANFMSKDMAVVDDILDWIEWLASQPFMPKECLTGEEKYRGLTALPCLTLAGIAKLRNRPDAYDAALRLARAHVAWCLLGLGPVAGKEIVNHHLDSVSEPCVLIGTKRAKFPIRRVAQAGKRGWVRNRDGGPKRFLFTGHLTHSVMVYQALGWDIHRKVRKNSRWPVETYEAIRDRFPGLKPWGFDAGDQILLRRFAEDPASRQHVRGLLPHLLPTSLPVAFYRYADGSVVSLLLKGDSSSTDSLMIDAAYATGEIRLTSADDGLRVPAIRQTAWEETLAFACQAEDKTGPVMRVPKPEAPLAHVVVSREGRTVLVGEDAVTAAPPATPPHAEPPPVVTPCPIWKRWMGLC